MGLSVVVSAGILVLAVLSLMAAIQFQFISSGEALDEVFSVNRNRVIRNRWNVALAVESVSFSASNRVYIRAVNVGAVGIPEGDFKIIDVIVVYYLIDGRRVAEYLR